MKESKVHIYQYAVIITQVISNCVMNDDAIWMAGWVPSQFKVVFKDSNYPQIQRSTGSYSVCVWGGKRLLYRFISRLFLLRRERVR